MSVTSLVINRMFKKGDVKRDKGLTTPENVYRVDNIPYGKNKKWQILDLYLPKEMPHEKLPVIVSVHGGAWVYGTKETYQFYCMSLVKRGFAVVNFTYRLAPKYKFPTPMEDTNLVMKWVLENAEKYNLDVDNIFAVGDSAGGNDLAFYAGILTNNEFAKKFSFKVPAGLKLKGIALNCGKYNLTRDDVKNRSAIKMMKDYLGNKSVDKMLEIIDATKGVTKDFPPTFLMTCNKDFLREQAPVMEKCLKENGVKYEYHFYGDDNTQLSHVFHLNMKLPMAEICNDDECNFFKGLM